MYQTAMKNLSGKWYGFDIDGTIADNSAHTFGMGRIGKPIKPMCDLMKRLHAEGKRVKIFTARLSDVGSDAASQEAVKEHIWKWCDEHLGFRPEITDRKDYKMECLYDDRAKQVVRNTGECLEDLYRELSEKGEAMEGGTRESRAKARPASPRAMTAEERNLDKVRGCLFGGAAGDALGYPVEFMDERQIRSRFGEGGIREYQLDPATGKALISDDTQMTLFTATGILVGNTRGRLRGVMGPLWSYAAQHYLDWIRTQEVSLTQRKAELRSESKDGHVLFQHSWLVNERRLYKCRAPGTTCLSGIRARIDGEWPKGGPSQHPVNDSKGCGGVMRVAPVGLYLSNMDRHGCDDDRQLMEMIDREAAETAAFTHGHPLGYMPAAVLAHIVNRLAYPTKDRPEGMSVREAVCEARDAVRELFAGDRHVGDLVSIINRAIQLADGPSDDGACIRELGEGWVGDEALAIAIFCALRHHDDFSSGIIAAVNHSGDSDSTGAITGNILGAHLGYDAIEDKWKRDLELSDVILELSDDLCRKCQMSENGSQHDSVWLSKYGCVFPKYVVGKRQGSLKQDEDVESMISAMNLKLVKGHWYGFDIDGTIATNHLHGWEIEEPVKPMVALMKWLHRNGYEVRILSGRTGDFHSDDDISPDVKELVWAWCDRHLGFRPALTGRKDSAMEALFDDRAKQVVCSRGVAYEALARELAKALDDSLRAPTVDRKAFAALRDRCADLGLLRGEQKEQHSGR